MEKYFVYHSHEDFGGRTFIPWSELALTEQMAVSESEAMAKVKEKYPFDEIFYASTHKQQAADFWKIELDDKFFPTGIKIT